MTALNLSTTKKKKEYAYFFQHTLPIFNLDYCTLFAPARKWKTLLREIDTLHYDHSVFTPLLPSLPDFQEDSSTQTFGNTLLSESAPVTLCFNSGIYSRTTQPENPSPLTVIHESFHAAQHVIEFFGIEDGGAKETTAYLLEFFVKSVFQDQIEIACHIKNEKMKEFYENCISEFLQK